MIKGRRSFFKSLFLIVTGAFLKPAALTAKSYPSSIGVSHYQYKNIIPQMTLDSNKEWVGASKQWEIWNPSNLDKRLKQNTSLYGD